MPALEMAQETGKLVAWLKKEGESVARGELLLEIETDKATVEVESPGDGVLAEVSAHPGEDIPVGRIIAWILGPGEKAPGGAANRDVVAAPAREPRASGPAAAPGLSQEKPGALRISPKARKLAKDAGIDLSKVTGSGADGEILTSDVQAAINRTGDEKAVQPVASAAPLPTVHRLMAERTTQSWTTIPHFFLQKDVDASNLVRFREQPKNAGITVTDLLIAVTARVLMRHPPLNASWIDNGIQFHPGVHLALAVAVEDGVTTPVIHDAGQKSVDVIAAERRELVDRARRGALRPGDLAGATFTISNLGMFGVDAFTAIIVPPQAAILAAGQIADRVVAINGIAAVRPRMILTLSSDHRVFDGAKGAAFLQDLADTLGSTDSY